MLKALLRYEYSYKVIQHQTPTTIDVIVDSPSKKQDTALGLVALLSIRVCVISYN